MKKDEESFGNYGNHREYGLTRLTILISDKRVNRQINGLLLQFSKLKPIPARLKPPQAIRNCYSTKSLLNGFGQLI